MRPFHQADPNLQLTLVDRGNRPGSLDGADVAAPRGARRAAMSDALAGLAFRKLFVLSHVARSDLERNRARTA
jgi:hypothetical protein